jgi:hypothetical protein
MSKILVFLSLPLDRPIQLSPPPLSRTLPYNTPEVSISLSTLPTTFNQTTDTNNQDR